MSPLFALEAEELLLSGEIAKAIELCEKGLELYPDYPAALAILAKALEMSGNSEKSQEKIDEARSYFSSNKVRLKINEDAMASASSSSGADESLEENAVSTSSTSEDAEVSASSSSGADESLEENAVSADPGSDDYSAAIADDHKKMALLIDNDFAGARYVSRVKTSAFGSNGEMSRLIEQSTRKKAEKLQIEVAGTDKFMRMAAKIQGAKIQIASERTTEIKTTGKMNIITDTIAEILEKQGALSEALDAWKALQQLNPERAEFYESKIATLNAKMS